MRVTVRLFGDLRRYLPKGQELLELELPDGATPGALLRQVGIHPGEVWLLRANKQIIQEDHPLQDGDELEIFEPVGGGEA